MLRLAPHEEKGTGRTPPGSLTQSDASEAPGELAGGADRDREGTRARRRARQIELPQKKFSVDADMRAANLSDKKSARQAGRQASRYASDHFEQTLTALCSAVYVLGG